TKTEVVEAMKLGAVNFNEKGENFNRIKFLADINQAISLKFQEAEINSLRKQSLDSFLIGKHPKMKHLKEKIMKFSQSEMNLLITGETGTGKGLIAELIHQNSSRKDKPFKSIDIKSIPETLLESELFGHKKGAFTDAKFEKKGYFENAEAGTLFIDEISNMSLENQAKLLKVIDEKQIPVVGSGGQFKKVNVRIISAANCDLTEMVRKGEFRKDLYFRFANCLITIPPLRERASDITVLMEKFLMDYTREFNKSLDINLKNIRGKLESYSFPGNVRELKNLCRFITEFYEHIDNEIILDEFEKHINRNQNLSEKSLEIQYPLHHNLLNSNDFYRSLEDYEKLFLKHHLEKNLYRVSRTAEAIGLDRTTLYKKMKKYGIEIP
ncbi:MAG TPA: sigma-54-dependent Fis family transcriptional regulator, partial [Candidatus Cloacimonetes bacterium]|nr:sigma-54-dependent Fis family transcriptional regulator [Candidatus Cloacimonadota bacterium]